MTHEIHSPKPAVSDKVKRRWYQFSLRTLLVTIAVLAVGLSVWGRIAFLRQRAQFHDAEALRCIESQMAIDKRHGSPRMLVSLEETYGPEDAARLLGLTLKYRRHSNLAKNYRSAVFRPWTIIDESMPEAAP